MYGVILQTNGLNEMLQDSIVGLNHHYILMNNIKQKISSPLPLDLKVTDPGEDVADQNFTHFLLHLCKADQTSMGRSNHETNVSKTFNFLPLGKGVLAIRRIFSLVDTITKLKFSNCPNIFKIGLFR